MLAASFALVMVVGVSLVRMNSGERGNTAVSSPGAIAAEPGTAVGDLQALEKNQNLYSDFGICSMIWPCSRTWTANP